MVAKSVGYVICAWRRINTENSADGYKTAIMDVNFINFKHSIKDVEYHVKIISYHSVYLKPVEGKAVSRTY